MNQLFIDWQPSLEAFSLGPIAMRWYSLLWVIGLLAAYLIVQRLYTKQNIPQDKFEPLFLYCFIGVLLGARLGHCLFYEPDYFLTSAKGWIEMFIPIRFAPDTWDWHFTGYTGLASHGGTFGLIMGIWLYSRNEKVNLMTVLDNIAIACASTAACIRLGNLMNSEIIGNPTDMPWGFIFHTNDAVVNGVFVPRHPAQLYEAIAYIIILIIGLALYRKYPQKVGTGYYLGYCLFSIFTFRFFIEFIKKEQEAFEQGMLLDMGQLLSIPFILIGLYFLLRKKSENEHAYIERDCEKT